MMDFRIFAESKADIKFLGDYIAELFDKTLSKNKFDPLGSWSGYRSKGKPKASILQAVDEEKSILLILDADNNYQTRRNEVMADFERFGIPLNLFLFPNNTTEGNLEDMLSIIAVDRTPMECFHRYEECVQSYPKKLNHERIYSYLLVKLLDNYMNEKMEDMRKDEFRNYRNQDHWNLNHEYLQPLKDFLTPLFTQNK
jgi:hypothetical protein